MTHGKSKRISDIKKRRPVHAGAWIDFRFCIRVNFISYFLLTVPASSWRGP